MQVCEFCLDGLTLRGKRWGKVGATPVIALHGWLDNCASFDYLAPLLKNVDLVTLDLAGQGLSCHRASNGAYNIWLDIVEILTVVEQLGWTRFGLLGHSRGGMIATMIAGTFPERISHLALVEGFAPHMIDASQAPAQLASAVSALLNMEGRRRSNFSNFDSAVKAREKGFLPLVHEDALVLAKRGVIENNNTFQWANDIRLNVPSEVKLTPEQARAFVDQITVPIQLVLAKKGLISDIDHMEDFIAQTTNILVHHLEGEHHLHMSQQCTEVAKIFNDYFSS